MWIPSSTTPSSGFDDSYLQLLQHTLSQLKPVTPAHAAPGGPRTASPQPRLMREVRFSPAGSSTPVAPSSSSSPAATTSAPASVSHTSSLSSHSDGDADGDTGVSSEDRYGIRRGMFAAREPDWAAAAAALNAHLSNRPVLQGASTSDVDLSSPSSWFGQKKRQSRSRGGGRGSAVAGVDDASGAGGKRLGWLAATGARADRAQLTRSEKIGSGSRELVE